MNISETTAGKYYAECMSMGRHYANRKICGISNFMNACRNGAVRVKETEYGFHQRTTYADGSTLVIWNDMHETTVFVVYDKTQYCINYQGIWVAYGKVEWD